MAKTVKAQVLRQNTMEFACVQVKAINCENTVTQGVYWRTPIADKGLVVGYEYKMGEKPVDDAVKVIRVTDNDSNTDYWIAVADDATENLFGEKCNICCGNSSDMPAVTIPTPVVEEQACQDEDGNYTYFTFADDLGAGEVYQVAASKNGTKLTPANPGEGFATLAAFKTWAASNWDDFGTFDYSGDKVTFVSTDGESGAITVSKANAFVSGTAPSPGTGGLKLAVVADGVAVGDVTDDDVAAVVVAANASASLSALGVFASVSSGTKIQLTSTTVGAATLTVTAVTA